MVAPHNIQSILQFAVFGEAITAVLVIKPFIRQHRIVHTLVIYKLVL